MARTVKIPGPRPAEQNQRDIGQSGIGKGAQQQRDVLVRHQAGQRQHIGLTRTQPQPVKDTRVRAR
jgi:hypothetical protein